MTRLRRSLVRAALPLLAVAVACQPRTTATSRPQPMPPADHLSILDLVGGWRWLHRTEEAGTSRVEAELWRLRPDTAAPTRLVGRYLRTVEVRSTDGVPFQCSQQLWYRQRALFDVIVELDGDHFAVRETGYQTEPTPCDHDFRHTSVYAARPHGNRLVLRWDGGEQTLWQVDEAVAHLPDSEWSATPDPTGAWRWQATSFDDDGNVRDEAEWWEITRRTDTRLDVTYRRRVTVRSVDGAPLTCAAGPTWSFDDAYVLHGQKEEEHWHFYEVAVEPGDHPCLRPTPKRTIDEATAEQIGDFLVLEWRGKRRQVLHRPERRD